MNKHYTAHLHFPSSIKSYCASKGLCKTQLDAVAKIIIQPRATLHQGMVTEGFTAPVNYWPPAATSLSQSTVVPPVYMKRCGFARGRWWVPLYFNCRIQENLQFLQELASRKHLPMPEGRWESVNCPQEGWTIQTQLEQQVSIAAAVRNAPRAPFLLQLCPS